MRKLDKYLFAVISKMVCYFVKKSKFTLSKYRVFLRIIDLYLVFQISVVFIIVAVDFQDLLQKSLYSLFWLPGIFIWIYQRNQMALEAQDYDLIFILRKDPRIYSKFKFLLEELFKSTVNSRIFILTAYGTILILALIYAILSFINFSFYDIAIIPVILGIILDIAEVYLLYIFDFEEPPKRKKRAKDSLTDVVKKLWENLIRSPGLSPT